MSVGLFRRFVFVTFGSIVLIASFATGTTNASPALVTNVQFSSSTFRGAESTSAVVTISRTGDTTITSSVTISTVAGGSATAGACGGSADYVATSQTVTFDPGELTKTVNITLCPDVAGESGETINLALSSPSAGTTLGSPSTAVLTIIDAVSQYRNSTAITVNSGSAGSPYPSNIVVSGATTNIARIRVTLFDFVPTPGNHVDVLLVGPNGAAYVLMAHVGVPNPPAGPVTLTFFDFAPAVLPTFTPLTSGTFRPTSCDELGSFPAPAPGLPYVEPGCDVDRTIAETLFGTFGSSNPNGTWSLYVREDEVPTGSLVGTFLGGWGIEFMAATSADGVVGGRVLTPDGSGLRGARVTITDSQGSSRTVITSSLGYYQFDEIDLGKMYIISASAKRYRFEAKAVQASDSLTEVNFVGIE